MKENKRCAIESQIMDELQNDRREFARFEKERGLCKWDTVIILVLRSKSNQFLSKLVRIASRTSIVILYSFYFREKIRFSNKLHQHSKIRHMRENVNNVICITHQFLLPSPQSFPR